MVRWSSVDSLLVLVVFQSSQQVDKHGSEESVVIVPLLQNNNRKNKQTNKHLSYRRSKHPECVSRSECYSTRYLSMSMSSGLMRRSLDRASLMMLMPLQVQNQHVTHFIQNIPSMLRWTVGGATDTVEASSPVVQTFNKLVVPQCFSLNVIV